jgi:hypothetical protein
MRDIAAAPPPSFVAAYCARHARDGWPRLFRFRGDGSLLFEAPFSLYAGGTVEIQKMLIARAIGV